MADVPIGIKAVQYTTSKCKCGPIKPTVYKVLVFVLTFITYMCYHASRKPISVVKTHLSRNCEHLEPPPDLIINDTNRKTWCDWAPFDQPNASVLLGLLDSAFLFAYAFFMFFSGFIADRVSLRYFLAIGMILSGISNYLMGIAKSYDIHSMWYFTVVQIFGGIAQTTGWPGVVAVMGHWFGKAKRGLIFGLWNSHTSVGNIVGTLLASLYLETNWGLSFIVPGLLIAAFGFINFLFLPEAPGDVIKEYEDSCDSINEYRFEDPTSYAPINDSLSDTEPLISPKKYCRRSSKEQKEEEAVNFLDAFKIPGVIEFSLCLFFAKLVSYTFLYWLPYYINSSTSLSESYSSLLSTIFDIGGILGGIVAGLMSDYSSMNATTCGFMLIVSIPLLAIYNIFGSEYLWLNVIMLTLVGFFVNGPYALITTAVSAELGTHPSLTGNAKALATVTAIIDGTGSIGAAVGPMLAGVVYKLGWSEVFYMLIISDIMALLMLVRLMKKEFRSVFALNSDYQY